MSETNWNAPYVTPNFVPQVFIAIEASLSRKLESMAMFRSPVREFPHERSIEALQRLAAVRGTSVHRPPRLSSSCAVFYDPNQGGSL